MGKETQGIYLCIREKSAKALGVLVDVNQSTNILLITCRLVSACSR